MRKAAIMALALLCLPIAQATGANTALTGQKSVVSAASVAYDEWLDAARQRTIPVKIYIPTTGGAPYPVLIFSHGLGGSREAAQYLGEHLAGHGYVCIHVQHHGSDELLWKPIATGGREAILGNLRSAANAANLVARIADIKFVLDELERRNNGSGALSGKLDLKRIALAGHSFGAGTALAIAGQNYGIGDRLFSAGDPRIKAAIYLSPPVALNGHTPQQIFGDIRVPGMLMTGTEDYSPIGSTGPKDRLIPFDGIGTSDQYLIVFDGGDHMIFSGRMHNEAGSSSDEEFHKMINELTTAFLDAYLCGNQKAKQWLQRDAGSYLGKAAEFKFK